MNWLYESLFSLAVDFDVNQLQDKDQSFIPQQADAVCNAKRPSERTGKLCCELSLLLFA